LTNSPALAGLSEKKLPPEDHGLPINLATALRLSDARPLLIAAAQARVQIAAAQLDKARVLWLPNLNLGADYIRHMGGAQNTNGTIENQGTNFFYGGGSLEVRFASTDAIFEPLAAQQVLQARQTDIQTARNDALMVTADAYFSVQQARGSYAALMDATEKGRDLVKRVESLAKGLAPQDEIDRSRTLLAELEQSTALARQQWRVASARLTRVLRLNPASVVEPLEPDHLQVTLIEPSANLDDLIPIGLTNRPELASHQAIVQATLIHLRQERLRPLIPSVLITGNGSPDFLYQVGAFGTGTAGRMDQWAGRGDVSAQLVWKLENLGFGYRAKVREKQGQVQLEMVELYNVQDQVAAEVTQTKADVDAAVLRVREAEEGLKRSLATYAGNLKGLGQTTRFGDVLSLVNRPQEAVAALQQLQLAYVSYYRTVGEYNRAQFYLFHALGFPASYLACDRPTGPIEPVDTTRPAPLPPVGGPGPR
jgi:outer membrane protein TolC